MLYFHICCFFWIKWKENNLFVWIEKINELVNFCYYFCYYQQMSLMDKHDIVWGTTSDPARHLCFYIFSSIVLCSLNFLQFVPKMFLQTIRTIVHSWIHPETFVLFKLFICYVLETWLTCPLPCWELSRLLYSLIDSLWNLVEFCRVKLWRSFVFQHPAPPRKCPDFSACLRAALVMKVNMTGVPFCA